MPPFPSRCVFPRSQTLFGNVHLRNSVSPPGQDSKQSFETGVPKQSLGTRICIRYCVFFLVLPFLLVTPGVLFAQKPADLQATVRVEPSQGVQFGQPLLVVVE